MTLLRITAPTVEPVTTAEAKLHLRVTHSTDDDLIDALIAAARDQAIRRCHAAENRLDQARQLLAEPLMYLSGYLKQHQAEYNRRLSANRPPPITTWGQIHR